MTMIATFSFAAARPAAALPLCIADTARVERRTLALASAVVLLGLSAAAVLAQQTPPQPEAPATPPAATSPAPTPAPSAPAPAKPSPAVASWQQALVARLDRFKSYPSQANGAEGVVTVSFRIDRQGKVVNSQVVKSSGSSVLDAAALALVKRASPFPPPPADLSDSDLSIAVPVRYAAADKG
jgi:TonB family protein